MIELDAVTKTFNAGKPNRFNALRGINLKIGLRRVTVFKGPSGSGKTTVLSLIGCMMRPTAGRVRIRGRETSSLPESFLARIRRESFGFVFQQFNLIPGVTVLENVMLPAYPTRRTPREIRVRALYLLEALEILSKAQSPAQLLSGGEQQRAAIARALINDPEFIVADEPTAHLDIAMAAQLLEVIAGLKALGKTVLMAGHDPVLFSPRVADRVIELRDGHLAAEA